MKKKKKKTNNNNNIKRDKIGEGERERELTFFVVNNLEGIGERGGNEVKEIYKKIKLEEEEWKQMKGSKKWNCRIYEDERFKKVKS